MEKEKVGYELTEDIVKELKCSLCEHSLSVSPISIISEDATKYKCGRCHGIKTYVETRCYMYEKLAKHMIFPCIYAGCEEKLEWSQVKEHEKKCEHRKIVCPKQDCDVQVGVNDFITHFKEKHKESYHQDKLSVSNVQSYYSLDLLEKDGRLYFAIFDYNDHFCGVSVCSLEPDDHKYELTLNSDSSRQSIVATQQNIIPFDEKVHCFKCISGVCKSEFHLFRYYKNGILKRMTTKLDKQSITRTFRGRRINYHLAIVDEKEEHEEDLDDLVKDMVVDEVNDEEEEEFKVCKDEEIVRRMLECPNCLEYMQSPIYQCITGHTICNKCKEKVEKCPTCQAEIDNTRNYILEDISTNLKLPSQPDKNEEAKVEDKEIMCPMGTKTYLVLFDYHMPNFVVSICSISGPDETRYEVKLMSYDGKLAFVATDQKIIPFDDTEHCFKCISGSCKDEKHKYRLIRYALFKRFTTKFNRDQVLYTFGHKKLNYEVNLIDSRKVFQKELLRKKDKIFRQMYECPICKDYMMPPIHQCVAGHVLCNACKGKVEKCPSCEGAYSGTRNYILEDVVESIVLPCQFVTESCPFRAGVKRIASHELECPLNNKKVCTEAEEKTEDVKQEAE
ncbi:hypothetical protein NQ315_015275 [Exocentrus adspersus]|uniref:RING-type E3 ubiquitin transferase n=1 Tax=Exocentrus adspersus TaxID=1586481 RepID=A0AAV8VBB4_9CUCU|nr:hypothetical protein NQ315_015275 [Exocentrus adspersus]